MTDDSESLDFFLPFYGWNHNGWQKVKCSEKKQKTKTLPVIALNVLYHGACYYQCSGLSFKLDIWIYQQPGLQQAWWYLAIHREHLMLQCKQDFFSSFEHF